MSIASLQVSLQESQVPKRQTLGGRIAQARRELGVREHRDVSQLDLAAAVGVSPATLSRWESDLSAPRDEAFVTLAKVLGVDPGYLRYGGGTREAAEDVSLDEFTSPEGSHLLTAEDREQLEREARAQRPAAPAKKRRKGA